MALVQELLKGTKTTVLGETLAMATAELGQFREAADIQRGVMAAAQRSGLDRDVRRMTDNLQRYERGQACRVPWPDDDPAHIPAMFASPPPGSPTAGARPASPAPTPRPRYGSPRQ